MGMFGSGFKEAAKESLKKVDTMNKRMTERVWLECQQCGIKGDEYKSHVLYGVTDDLDPVFKCESCGCKSVYVYSRKAL